MKKKKGIRENKKIDFYVALRGNRLYLESPEYNSFRVKIDITSVFLFCKEVLEHPKNG